VPVGVRKSDGCCSLIAELAAAPILARRRSAHYAQSPELGEPSKTQPLFMPLPLCHPYGRAKVRKGERCLTRGAPKLPGGYNNNVQIVQSSGYVALLQEMIHEARVIPVDGRPHWLAYMSNASGAYEIYVRAFPEASSGGGKWQISSGGGGLPDVVAHRTANVLRDSGNRVMAAPTPCRAIRSLRKSRACGPRDNSLTWSTPARTST
jgi:hypothetical protein